MKIGELAKETGVSTDTIRYYEKIGILPKAHRDANNYRQYTQQHVSYLQFIKNCRFLDMSQEEIQRLLRLATEPFESCDDINALLDEHILHVQERVKELLKVENMLKEIRQQCNAPTLVQHCGILAGLKAVGITRLTPSNTHVT